MKIEKDNILKEDLIGVEPLPSTMVTDFISRGWQTIGELKSMIEALKGFSGAEKVIPLVQSLLDAHLVFVGQLEGQLPEQGEPLVANITTPVIEEPSQGVPVEVPPEIETVAVNNDPEDPTNVDKVLVVSNPEAQQAFADAGDYFVDFDEPKPDPEADRAIADAIDALQTQNKAEEEEEEKKKKDEDEIDVFNAF